VSCFSARVSGACDAVPSDWSWVELTADAPPHLAHRNSATGVCGLISFLFSCDLPEGKNRLALLWIGVRMMRS